MTKVVIRYNIFSYSQKCIFFILIKFKYHFVGSKQILIVPDDNIFNTQSNSIRPRVFFFFFKKNIRFKSSQYFFNKMDCFQHGFRECKIVITHQFSKYTTFTFLYFIIKHIFLYKNNKNRIFFYNLHYFSNLFLHPKFSPIMSIL